MPKRGSRRLAQKASTRSKKKRSTPNVFVADTRSEPEEPREAAPAAPPEPAPPEAVAAPPRSDRPPSRPVARPRAVRRQQVRPRSEVFTHYLPQELRKIGILSAGMLTALILLTVFLR